jgi:hypothetical protein
MANDLWCLASDKDKDRNEELRAEALRYRILAKEYE